LHEIAFHDAVVATHWWREHRTRILRHYAFFSPLHREIAMRMSDFAWLLRDRLVQRSEFGGEHEIIANVSSRRAQATFLVDIL